MLGNCPISQVDGADNGHMDQQRYLPHFIFHVGKCLRFHRVSNHFQLKKIKQQHSFGIGNQSKRKYFTQRKDSRSSFLYTKLRPFILFLISLHLLLTIHSFLSLSYLLFFTLSYICLLSIIFSILRTKEKIIQAIRFQIEINLISSLKMSSTTKIDDPSL